MVFEIPTGLIREVQITLRKHAGIPTYDPGDSSLPSLPSLNDAVSGFEPSPPYLRCKQCNGKFLRGIASLICVYCGRQQRKDLPPEPIKFKSTIGYRWLLDALDLDGSEIVGPSEESELSRGKNSRQKDEVSLSDLLDLEIKWPDEYEKVEEDITKNKNTSASLNLAGVDQANYFTEANNDSTVDVSKKQLSGNTEISTSQGQKDLNLFENVQFVNKSSDRFADWEINSTESSSNQGHKNLLLVEDVLSSETGASSTNDKSDDRFSGWEAEFQSARSETLHRVEGSSSFDPFVVPTVDLSVHMDTVFGSGNFENQENPKEGSFLSSSTPNNRVEDDDVWSGFNSGVLNQAKIDEGTTSISRLQDDNWQISSTNAPNDDTNNDTGSFDTWNDFTSSTNKQENQNWDQVISSNEHTSEQNLFSSTSNFQSSAFGNFDQPDIFTGAFINTNNSKEVNIMQSEGSELDRNSDESAKEGLRLGQDQVKATTSSEAEDVEILMSQMHDLSFMLETNLSLPKS